PMHYKDITAAIIENKLVETVGKTPVHTVNAQLCSSKNLFKSLGSGIYCLVEESSKATAESTISSKACITASNLIQAYGMFWSREAVNWSKPKLLGLQSSEGAPINFNQMRGIYLLYDNREVIYVGQAIKQSILKRLTDHTKDRLTTRWNRFSWFGLDGVSDDGKIIKLHDPVTISIETLVDAFEGILIEGMEPRQNRKIGDNFGIEYLQKADDTVMTSKMIEHLLKK
ncbi:MAG: hypothetical protein K2G64_08265, partial [Muribaculaceae bacterium]|nr:hypothetical protein [Muribaculaceae bacterium]